MELFLFLWSLCRLSFLPMDLVGSSLTKAANGSAVEQQKDGYDPPIKIPPFSNPCLITKWNQRVSHICCVSLHRLTWLTLTPGVKMHLRYTHLNWISFPICKALTDCCTHLLSFSLFAPKAMHKWFIQVWEFTLYLSTSVTGGSVSAQDSTAVCYIRNNECVLFCILPL